MCGYEYGEEGEDGSGTCHGLKHLCDVLKFSKEAPAWLKFTCLCLSQLHLF